MNEKQIERIKDYRSAALYVGITFAWLSAAIVHFAISNGVIPGTFNFELVFLALAAYAAAMAWYRYPNDKSRDGSEA